MTMPEQTKKRFRVALSFAGEKREFVEEVAGILAGRFGRDAILYDKYHEAEFARHNLGLYLPKLYGEQADLIVPVICASYDPKRWTGWEWLHIYGLLTPEDGHRVMPSRFDHAKADGLSPAAGFIELDDKSPQEFARLILERLALNEGKGKDFYARAVSAGAASPAPVLRSEIPNNLPRLQPFFGREKELGLIREALDAEARTWGALIDGPGGMGKTSLAVRAAYECAAGQFKRIVFVSIKDREMEDDGPRRLGNLLVPGYTAMLNEIARELGLEGFEKSAEDARTRLLLEALRGAGVLLILDNLESLTKGDRDELFTLVKRLPQGCKAILTSRRRIGSSADTLILEKLEPQAALDTLEELARRNPLLARTNEAERLALYTQTGGKPLLLRWVAGQIGRGSCRTFVDALNFLRSCPADNDPLEFIFGDLANEFTPMETRVLVALSYFTLPVEVGHIAALVTFSRDKSGEKDTEVPNGAGVGRAVPSPPREVGEVPGAAEPPESPPASVARRLGTNRPTRAGSAMPGGSDHALPPTTTQEEIEKVLAGLANRSLVVPDQEEKLHALVPMVAEFLRKHRAEVMEETGEWLEKRAYALIMENGGEEYERFPVLDAAWPSVAPAMARFLTGQNERLQVVCGALDVFLNFTGRWDDWLELSQQAEARAVVARDHVSAGWRAYQAGCLHYRRGQTEAVLACAERATAHWTEAFPPGDIGQAGTLERATAIRLRGIGFRLKKDCTAAIAAFREVVALLRSLSPESDGVSGALNSLAAAEYHSGDLTAAERDFREALRVAQAIDHTEGIASCTGNLASLAMHRGDWAVAEALAFESLVLSEKVGRQELIAEGCHILAGALVCQGRGKEGQIYARRAVAIYTRLSVPSDIARAKRTLAECEEAVSRVR